MQETLSKLGAAGLVLGQPLPASLEGKGVQSEYVEEFVDFDFGEKDTIATEYKGRLFSLAFHTEFVFRGVDFFDLAEASLLQVMRDQPVQVEDDDAYKHYKFFGGHMVVTTRDSSAVSILLMTEDDLTPINFSA